VSQATYRQEPWPTSLYGTLHGTRLPTGESAPTPISGRRDFKVRSISLNWLVVETGEDALQMDILRGQPPRMVRKHLWGRLLVHDVVRGLMAQAARPSGQQARKVKRRPKIYDRRIEPRAQIKRSPGGVSPRMRTPDQRRSSGTPPVISQQRSPSITCSRLPQAARLTKLPVGDANCEMMDNR
jgi:hypothetical protein